MKRGSIGPRLLIASALSEFLSPYVPPAVRRLVFEDARKFVENVAIHLEEQFFGARYLQRLRISRT